MFNSSTLSRNELAKTLALRLHPGTDVRHYLEDFAIEQKIGAGVILGAVGSLSKTCLRFANNRAHTELSGKQEVLTLSGMLSDEGVHLHMSVADSKGECKGGHVAYGCIVYTTLEIAIAHLRDVRFQRVLDKNTGFKELKITQ